MWSIPEPAPSLPVSVTVGVAYQPFEIAGEIDDVEVGSLRSTLTVIDFVASRFPAVSVDAYCTVWLPSVLIVNGAVYVCQEPPSIAYCVEATPDVASAPVSVTVTGTRHQPALPGVVHGADAVVVGAVVSTVNVDEPVCWLPALSVARNCTVCEPSPLTTNGAV